MLPSSYMLCWSGLCSLHTRVAQNKYIFAPLRALLRGWGGNANVKWGGSVTKYDQIRRSGLARCFPRLSHCSPVPSPYLAPNSSPFPLPIQQPSLRCIRRCRPQCKLYRLTSCRHINGLPSPVSSTETPPCCPHPQLQPESASELISTQSLTQRCKKSIQMEDSEKSLSSRTLLHLPRLHPQPLLALMATPHHTNLPLILHQ